MMCSLVTNLLLISDVTFFSLKICVEVSKTSGFAENKNNRCLVTGTPAS